MLMNAVRMSRPFAFRVTITDKTPKTFAALNMRAARKPLRDYTWRKRNHDAARVICGAV